MSPDSVTYEAIPARPRRGLRPAFVSFATKRPQNANKRQKDHESMSQEELDWQAVNRREIHAMTPKRRSKDWMLWGLFMSLGWIAGTGCLYLFSRYVVHGDARPGIVASSLFYWIIVLTIDARSRRDVSRRRIKNPGVIDLDLVVARPTTVPEPQEGFEYFSWTLTTRLSHMLDEAEAQFGERDRSYTIVGVEFAAGHPRVWYPGSRKHVAVQLGLECLTNPRQACYQLAHETIHLLSPSGGKNSICLEEGIACVFASAYMKKYFSLEWPPASQSYLQAAIAAEALLALKPDIIKTLRLSEPTISKISSQTLIYACPGLDPSQAEYLCSRFVADE
jgi:hypothetical protein